MNMIKIIVGLVLILSSIAIVNGEGEIIKGDTIFIDNDDIFMSATPHTLYESGNVVFNVRTKKYSGDIDLIWGFNKATAKIKSIKHPNENIRTMKKPDNKIVNKNHLLYKDERKQININNEIEFIVWIDVNDLSSGKYDFMIKPSGLTIDEAKLNNQLYILDPWWDTSFKEYVEIHINNRFEYGKYDHQCNINITYNNGMQSDFDDIRFIDVSGTLVVLPYWIESKVNGSWANVWFKAQAIFAHSWTNDTIRMYYGNSGVPSVESMTDTFIQSNPYANSDFNLGTTVAPPFVFESRCYHSNTASIDSIGVSNGVFHAAGVDSGWFTLSNAYIAQTHLSNAGTVTSVTHAGTYHTLADYKIIIAPSYGAFYADDQMLGVITTNVPDGDTMGIRYDVGATAGYTNWSFIRKYSEVEPTVHIGKSVSQSLKYNLTSNIINTVYSDGKIICGVGSYTNWTASSISNYANITISSYSGGKGSFIISDGVIDYIEVQNFNNDSIAILYQDDLLIETGIVKNNVYKFNTDLSNGNYNINLIEYDNITGVHGFIYQGVSSSNILLNEVVVYIYNNTWSDTTVSSNGGYYAFTNLTNSTYTLNFKKDRYEEILYQYVTPANRSMYRKDVYMQKSTGDYYSRHYCTFILKNIYGTKFKDVNAIVYENDVVETSGVTGYDGGVVFHLFEDVEYKITFIDPTQNINEEILIFPRDNKYIIWVGSYDFVPENNTRLENVNYWWDTNQLNLAETWLNFSYSDTDNKTTFIEYWINDTDNNNIYYISQINPCASGVYEINYIVNSSNNTYVVHFSAHHPDYPGLENSVIEIFSFFHKKLIDLLFSEQWQYTVLALVFIILFGTVFGATNAPQGSLIIVLLAWFFSFIQWLPSTTVGYGALVLATLLSVGWNLRKSETVHT